MEVVLATSNPGKARESRAILEDSGIHVSTVPLWLGEVETGTTFEENARLKAAAALRMVHKPVLAEDAGLEVDALHGLPGVHSARFAGPAATPAQNNAKLLRLLEGVTEREARYRVVAVLLFPTGRIVTGEGTLDGRVTESPRGEGGFGYDPIFVPAGEERTVAEMGADEKNLMSHRAMALRTLLGALEPS